MIKMKEKEFIIQMEKDIKVIGKMRKNRKGIYYYKKGNKYDGDWQYDKKMKKELKNKVC